MSMLFSARSGITKQYQPVREDQTRESCIALMIRDKALQGRVSLGSAYRVERQSQPSEPNRTQPKCECRLSINRYGLPRERQQKKGQIPTACVRMVPEVARETPVTARHFSSVSLPRSVPPVPPGAGAVGYLAAPEKVDAPHTTSTNALQRFSASQTKFFLFRFPFLGA